MGKYMQNYLSAWKTTGMIIVKSLRLKLYKKTLKNNRVMRKCKTFYRDGHTDIYLYRKAELVEAASYVRGTSLFVLTV
jgi:hypothetical protein